MSDLEKTAATTATATKEKGDIVLRFLEENHDASHLDEVNDKDVVRKIDWRVVPLMLLCYTLQFLDKVVLNYANVMGLAKDTNLIGNQFSWLPTAFFIAYMFAEFPQGFFLQKFAPSVVLGVNVTIWGITTACTAACNDFASLMVVRILLGISEAAISPCLLLITTMWYTKREASFRCGIWYCGLGLGQIIGGVLSFLFQLLTTKFEGWRVLFIVLGIINLISGLLCYFFLPKNPITCNFLSDSEKYYLITKLSKNQTGTESRKFEPKQALELVLDIQSWLLLILTACISFSSNTITTFSSIDIASFGYNPKESALLNMPSGAVSIVSTLVSTYFVMKGVTRWLALCLLIIPAVTGGGLLSFLPQDNQAGLLIGIYLINTVVAPLAIVYSWVNANFAGHTKKIGANIFIMIGFSLGNIVGPQSYRSEEAPHYISAKISMLATQAACIVFALIIVGIYYMRNKKRDREAASSDASQVENEEQEIVNSFANMTDFQNRSFRYSY